VDDLGVVIREARSDRAEHRAHAFAPSGEAGRELVIDGPGIDELLDPVEFASILQYLHEEALALLVVPGSDDVGHRRLLLDALPEMFNFLAYFVKYIA